MASEQVFPAAPVQPRGFGLTPTPFQFLLTGEDGIRVSAVHVVPDLRLSIVGRFLEAGKPHVGAFAFSFEPAANGFEQSANFHLGTGVILNLAVIPSLAYVPPGRCYVRVDVVRGTGARVVLGTLIAGYVGAWGGRAWPGTPLETPFDGPGDLLVVAGSAPAAGAKPLVDQTGRTRWRVTSVLATLTTAAGGVNRIPVLSVFQSSTVGLHSGAPASQAPSTTRTYCWQAGIGFPPAVPASHVVCALASALYLSSQVLGEARLEIPTEAIAAADQWSAMNVLVEEWRNPITTFGLFGI